MYPRVAGRLNNIVKLNMNFTRNGVLQDPYAIRRIDIYRSSIAPGNIVQSIIFPDPSDSAYDTLVNKISDGKFEVLFDVPANFVSNDIYFDVWRFVGGAPGSNGLDDESNWISQNGMFWLFEDVWLSDDELVSKRIGFEPLDKKFRRGEIRKLEVAIHPLPFYEYNYNLLAPIIPQLAPVVSIYTMFNELIVSDALCQIGVRQGSNRNSPFVIQCSLDTRALIIGTYKYQLKLNVGREVIISPHFYFTVQQ